MRKLFSIFAAIMVTASVFAQSPEKMSYQAVVRNNSDALVSNTQVGMQISILQGSTSGTEVFVETQTPTTNINGLVSIEIGNGSVIFGDITTIDWSAGPYFIKIETDPTGNTNYTITGTSQLLSVPYALHAKSAETVTGGISESDPIFSAWDKDYNDLTNKPNLFDGQYVSLTGTPTIPTDLFDLTDNSSLLFSGSYNDLSDIPSLFSGSFTDLTDKPTTIDGYGITDAFDGQYSSLSGTPTIFSGSFTDLTDKPTTIDGYGITDAVTITGNQTIAGNKTFSGTTTVTTPVNGSDAATKAYVDANAPTTYQIGDLAHGGIVFWVDETGQHGLVCATYDQSTGVRWHAGTSGETRAKADGVYSGHNNTAIIISAQIAIGDDGNSYAAQIANEHYIEISDVKYGGWYLPSKNELELMQTSKSIIDATATANGGTAFADAYYWSSTELLWNAAWMVYLGSGTPPLFDTGKYSSYRVRAVRRF